MVENLYQKINADLTKALKEKDEFRLSVLRMVKSKILYVNARGDLPEAEVVKIVAKYAKELKDSIEEFKKLSHEIAMQVAATDGGGLRPCAGVILGIDPVTLEVMIQPGMPSLYAVNTTLYDVVMPEKVYPNVSVTHYDFSRKADNGVGLLKVLLHCRQVRVTTAPAFSNTKSPSAASPISNGTEAPHAPTSTQNAAVGVGDQGVTVGAWKVQ